MPSSSPLAASLLVTDLDNTLWDWFGSWHLTFAPMLRALAERTGLPQAVLESEIRAVHQARGTSEYSALLTEIPSVRRLHPEGADLLMEYDELIHSMNKARLATTALYDGVLETLTLLKRKGISVVAYTESVAYWTEWRIKHTGLDGVLDVVYSSPDHDLPQGMTLDDLRKRPPEDYGLKHTRHEHVPPGVTKPDPSVIRTIVEDFKADPMRTVYVGDSLIKDVRMAQLAGVRDVHAQYGVSDGRSEYDLLRRVSHWPDRVVNEERDAALGFVVTPTFTINDFRELTSLFHFERDELS